jgi:hypothetical protein
MAAAALELSTPVQICTATVYDVLQSLKYPAVTNVRASPDYRDYPNHLVGPGYLAAWILGLKPSKDVTWSTADQPTVDFYSKCTKGGNHSNVELDLLLAAFSTGPVGLGDAVGYTNITRAQALIMCDGTVLCFWWWSARFARGCDVIGFHASWLQASRRELRYLASWFDLLLPSTPFMASQH